MALLPLTGAQYVDFPAICKTMGWDPAKLCGPVVMAAGKFPEGNCCYGHAKGSPLHTVPKVNGKPFALEDFKARFEREGLTGAKKELSDMRRAGGTPEGTARKIGKALIYPVPHFG